MHKPQKEIFFKWIQSISDLLASVRKTICYSAHPVQEYKKTTGELCEQITGYYQTFPSSQIIQEMHALKSRREHLNAL